MQTTAGANPGNTVIIKRLQADHGLDGFHPYRPLNADMVREVEKTVTEIFDRLGGVSLLKADKAVYIKPNGVGQQPYAYTRPEVIEAAVRYWFHAGASQVFLFENSTQAALTRLVFQMTGYADLCRRTGAQPIFLDEDETVPFEFMGKDPTSNDNPQGYDRTIFGMPRTVAEKLIQGKDRNLYVSIPKLKTHGMTVVTLGIKNQWGFAPHRHRIDDHNYNLHSKLVDVLSHLRPDVTLIDGVEGTIYGHYPPYALVNKCIRPFKVLIGGLNVAAVDIVGARIFGFKIDDVPHLKLTMERGLGNGVASERDITITGDYTDFDHLDILNEWAEFGGRYPNSLYPDFPDDVPIIKGRDMACMDGCVSAALAGLQLLALDNHGQGGWALVAGKGFNQDEIDSLPGPVLVAGTCAVDEVGDRLVSRLGKRKVYLTPGCCDITAITEALCHVMKVNPMGLAPGLKPVKLADIIIRSKWNRSHGRQINPLCGLIKMR